MESRNWIRHANTLMDRMTHTGEDRHQLQADLNRHFSALQTPSLIAAANLRDAAERAGLTVAPNTLKKIAEGEQMHPQV